MQQHTVEPVGDAVRGGQRHAHAVRVQGIEPVFQGVVVGKRLAHVRFARGLRAGQQAGDGVLRLAETVTVLGADGGDLDAHFARQALAVDLDAETAGLIAHVEQQQHRQAEFLELQGQRQLAVELGRVGDHQQQVDRVVLQEAARDALVLGETVQVVEAGQVDDLDHVGAEQHLRRQQVDGDTRPVADFRRRAGQAIEEGRLAGIRHAEQRDTLHSRVSSSTSAACCGRISRSEVPMRTCNGPP